jgi:enoyl-CoA hydratase/carnithine racemase
VEVLGNHRLDVALPPQFIDAETALQMGFVDEVL